MAEKKAPEKKKLPTAQKRDISNEKKRLVNKAFKTHARTIVRSFEEALEAKEKEQTQKALHAVYSVMDKGVKRGIYKPNKASRTKARFAQKVAQLSS